MGEFTWKINKEGKCVIDCQNINKYKQSLNDKSRYSDIASQINTIEENIKTQYNKYKKWIDKKILIGKSAKNKLITDVNKVKSLYIDAIKIDTKATDKQEAFTEYWKPIESKLKEAYLPNPEKWYKIQFPGFGNNYIAVNSLKENELLRIKKKPTKESYYRFKFIPNPEFKGWYNVKTFDNYYWHCTKRPSTYTDSGILLTKKKKTSITETFIINSIGNGRISIKGEGHDATGGRKQGVLSISQTGGNNRPDGFSTPFMGIP